MRKILAALAIAAALAAVILATREPAEHSGAQISPPDAARLPKSPTPPAPTAPDPASVAACRARASAAENTRALDLMRRGVVPRVAHDLAKTEAWHNAKACETDPAEPRRAIVLGADGIYRDAEVSK